jgi:hypothetical protein
MRLFEKVTMAMEYKIHPSLFLGDAFQEKRLDSLINAVDSFGRSERFKSIVLEMLSNEDDVYVMDLSEYANLADQDQESVRTLAKLMFKESKHWGNKSHKLKRINAGSDVELYLTNFTWLLRAVA